MELSPAERSLIYQALSRGFSFPQDELYVSLGDGSLFEVLSLVGEEAERLLSEAVLPSSLDDLQQEYTNSFDVGRGAGPPCSLYEGSHVSWGRTGIFEELLRFYDFFGLELSPSARELPNHLTVELEFMHYLTFLELEAEDPSSYQQAQKDFLERHLCQWVPPLRTGIEREGRTSVFRVLGAILERFIAAEALRFGLGSDQQ